MFTTTPKVRTTDQIIQPLLKMVTELETHIKNQIEGAAGHDLQIKELEAAKDFKLIDAEAAKKVLSNFKSLVG